MPEPVTLDLSLPPAPSAGHRSYALLRQEWKNRCDMASLAQLAGAPRIDGPFELAITLRPGSNGAQLQSHVNDLVAYLRERAIIHSAGPNHMRKLTLAWAAKDEAPQGCTLKLRAILSESKIPRI